MKLGATFLALGLVSLVRGQSVGADGITTVSVATCTTTGTQTYAFIDTASSTYQYMCGGGSGGTAYSTVPSASRLRRFFISIHQNQGAAYGIGPGQCILKSGNINFVSTTSLLSTRIAVLNTRYIAIRPSRVRNKIDK
ncbi:hypothetical protein KCU89_g14419, partial [Aureobasidium melanogenum]